MSVEADPMGWQEVLDDYERVLVEAEQSLDNPDASPDGVTIAPFIPPAEIGPLPAEQRDRAEDLSVRTAALVVRVRRLAETAAPNAASSRRRDRRGSHPVASFDLRA